MQGPEQPPTVNEDVSPADWIIRNNRDLAINDICSVLFRWIGTEQEVRSHIHPILARLLNANTKILDEMAYHKRPKVSKQDPFPYASLYEICLAHLRIYAHRGGIESSMEILDVVFESKGIVGGSHLLRERTASEFYRPCPELLPEIRTVVAERLIEFAEGRQKRYAGVNSELMKVYTEEHKKLFKMLAEDIVSSAV